MATIIKAGETGHLMTRLSTVDLSDHLAEAHAVIANAKRQAAQILENAKHQAEESRASAGREGFDAGHGEGYEKGSEEGRLEAREESLRRFQDQQTQLVSVLQNTLKDIERLKSDLATAAEKDLLDFSVLVASKLTFAVGRLYREAAAANLDRALRRVGSRTDVTIRVHPTDAASLEQFATSLAELTDASRHVHLVSDASIAPGGCKVHTNATQIDATLETQVDDMVALLLGSSSPGASSLETPAVGAESGGAVESDPVGERSADHA